MRWLKGGQALMQLILPEREKRVCAITKASGNEYRQTVSALSPPFHEHPQTTTLTLKRTGPLPATIDHWIAQKDGRPRDVIGGASGILELEVICRPGRLLGDLIDGRRYRQSACDRYIRVYWESDEVRLDFFGRRFSVCLFLCATPW